MVRRYFIPKQENFCYEKILDRPGIQPIMVLLHSRERNREALEEGPDWRYIHSKIERIIEMRSTEEHTV